jgi:signal transduction histidine kinase/ligand-binding sensor domain-containing protein/DNA-binding NarL/FixJ family response regulator
MTKQYLTFIILLFTVIDIRAQSYTFRRLGVEDGLSGNYVMDMVYDSKGCIWIATESGLNRFDGRSFTVYKKNNSEIVGNELNTLLYDNEENTLWIGSQRDGISVFDCTTYSFHNYTAANELATNDVTYLSHATDGGVWITHYHIGIEHYDKKTKRFRLLSDNSNVKGLKTPNWCAVEDSKGNLYVGHAFDGMSIINLKDSTVRNYRNDPENPNSIPGNTVYSICIDRQKNVWIGTNQGLALYNPQTDNFVCFRHKENDPFSLVADHIQRICEMSDGTLWIASGNGGISIFDLNSAIFMNPEKVKFRNIISTDSNMFPSGNIRSFLQDSFGNIWIGNFDYGINFISHTQPLFQMLPYTDAVKNKPVWGIFSDGEQIWAGGKNEIILFQNNQKKTTIDISGYTSNPHNQVIAIKKDMHGHIWVGLYNEGILRYDERNNRFSRIKLDISNIGFISFLEDTDGKMFIATSRGIFSYQNNQVVNEEKINNQLTDMEVYCILRDRQGKLWVGTFGKGIFVFDAGNQLVAHMEVDNGFCSNAILHLYTDSKGSIWAATRNGIVYFKDTAKPEDYEMYGDSEGIENSHVLAIQEDRNNNIWLSTDNGISFWDKQNRKFDNYNYRDDISMENFVMASACISPDGLIYFGSLGGVCYFDPKDFVKIRQVAPVHILDCKILNKQIESAQEGFFVPIEQGAVNLSYIQNSFRISFTVPDYSQSRQIEYAYMVEELENVWYDTHGENQVIFRNLARGKYTFKVKARLRNRKWDESNMASIIIDIHPPLWLTWYAKLFYIILVCMGIVGIIRFYRYKLRMESSLEFERKESRHKQELNDERLRFYTNITHELRTPLTLILGPLEDLQSDRNLPFQYSNKIKIIHDSAVRLLNLINLILEFRKTETQNCRLVIAKGDLKNLIMEIGLRYKELNRNDKVRFTIDIETDKTVLYFDADVITTILNNLLSNAVKYTSKGEIRLTLSSVTVQETEYTEIRVSDTGYGISPQDLPRIFDSYYQAKGKHQASGTGIGLALVKSLTDLHQGDIHVESAEGKGSVFAFRILTENTYSDALHRDAKKSAPTPETDREEYDADSHPLILVAEDDDDIREYVAASFASNSKVITAGNGKDALKLAQKHIPNIIISDIMMPVMNGIEFCRSVKEDVRTSHIPVILLTAKDTVWDKEEGYESGADSYLTKPFSAKLLTSRVRNLLESRRKLAQQITANAKKISPDNDVDAMKLSKPDKDFLTDVTRVIEENLCSDKLDIDFISDKMHMSHSTFYRKVKGLTGVSASEFIRKIRLKNSLQFLLSGNHNISEAAYSAGFNDLGYFRECFREEYGVSPSEYLKK